LLSFLQQDLSVSLHVVLSQADEAVTKTRMIRKNDFQNTLYSRQTAPEHSKQQILCTKQIVEHGILFWWLPSAGGRFADEKIPATALGTGAPEGAPARRYIMVNLNCHASISSLYILPGVFLFQSVAVLFNMRIFFN